MFRRKSLDKMMHPDSLDQLLVVVTPQAMFTVATLVIVLVVGIIWSIWARVPSTVDGQGILLKPRSLKPAQSVGSGSVVAVRALVGETVEAGKIIAELAQPDLDRQLEQDVARYQAIRDFNTRALELATKKRDLELSRIEGSLAHIVAATTSLSALQNKIRIQLDEVNETQAETLDKTRSILDQLRSSQGNQLKNIRDLVQKGISSDSQRLSAQGAVNETEMRIADLEVRMKQNALSRIEAEQQALRLTQDLGQQDNQRRQLEVQSQQTKQDFEYEEQRKTKELTEMAASIRVLKERQFRSAYIRSGFKGRLLEISVAVGELVSGGQRVAILQIEPQDPFFRLELAPDTGRGQFVLTVGDANTLPLAFDSSVEAVRLAISSLPALSGLEVSVVAVAGHRAFDIRIQQPKTGIRPDSLKLEVQDSDLTTHDGSPTFALVWDLGERVPEESLKHLGFFPVGLGKRVLNGMDIRINPTNFERQRFGSLMGKVSKVSDFPVTSEGIVNMIGNTDVAKALIKSGGTILVEADLIPDAESASDFKWTSAGPNAKLTPGTTTTCRITVEERAPITFAIPLLRKWFMGDADQLPQTSM